MAINPSPAQTFDTTSLLERPSRVRFIDAETVRFHRNENVAAQG